MAPNSRFPWFVLAASPFGVGLWIDRLVRLARHRLGELARLLTGRRRPFRGDWIRWQSLAAQGVGVTTTRCASAPARKGADADAVAFRSATTGLRAVERGPRRGRPGGGSRAVRELEICCRAPDIPLCDSPRGSRRRIGARVAAAAGRRSQPMGKHHGRHPGRPEHGPCSADFENIAIGCQEAKYESSTWARWLERLAGEGLDRGEEVPTATGERYKSFKGAMHEAPSS